jgi:predicted AAA+ superfamily ATPase
LKEREILSTLHYSGSSQSVTSKEALTHALIYGTYPAVAKETTAIDKKLRIKDIFQSYVQKDLVDFLKIEKTEDFNKLQERNYQNPKTLYAQQDKLLEHDKSDKNRFYSQR